MSRDDSVYYTSFAGGLAARVGLAARKRMYALFLREFAPGPATTVLDVGASTVETLESNVIERFYPHRANVTAAGLGDGDELVARYPGVRYVRIAAGAPLPFADGAFDVAHSNAVLEHVGGPDARRAFVRELLRVGRRLFLTVPNRWFPVEHHTALPLLHFHPPLFRAACRRLGRASWADPSELDFLDRGLLRREWPADRPVRIVMAGLPLGPFSSNIAVIA